MNKIGGKPRPGLRRIDGQREDRTDAKNPVHKPEPEKPRDIRNVKIIEKMATKEQIESLPDGILKDAALNLMIPERAEKILKKARKDRKRKEKKDDGQMDIDN